MIRRLLAPLLTFGVAAALAACAPTGDPTTDGELHIVASTNVYGDLAATIAGPDVVVTSIIDDPSADPHGFETNPRVQLALADADLVIANGGGYDDFVDEMVDASGNTSAVVLHAVDVAAVDVTSNEHVWYDYATIAALVDAIAAELDGIAPDAERAARVAELQAGIGRLAGRVAVLATGHGGEGAIVTEPLPLYLLDAAGLVNLTPQEFTEAIEQDTDVAPALLQEVLDRIPEASVVVVNGQTGGPQTDAVIAAASEAGVPWFAVIETLPDGLDYVSWQAGILDLLEDSLSR